MQLEYVKMVDAVWDTYISDSLNGHSRENILPYNWTGLFRVDRNKTKFKFKFVALDIKWEKTTAGHILLLQLKANVCIYWVHMI